MLQCLIKDDDISITIAGEAGQGIDTITEIIIKLFKISQYNVFSTKEYMSRVRGGINSSQIRISSSEISSCTSKIDFLFVLSENSVEHCKENISDETFIFYDDILKNISLNEAKSFAIPITSSSAKVGGKIFSNVIITGIIFGLFKLEISLIENNIRKSFSNKPEDVILKNLEAVKTGYELGQNILANTGITINIQKDSTVKEKIITNGAQSVALGCIAGGCDFISSYPMSPSTDVLTYLAQKSDDFNIIVEQAEDEISAINMGIGAWSVGARGMVTTAGGGFDLMVEGLSLAGMIESPMVIHLGQRPGPATGLPTRTEQADLNLALYGGHGEFPRIVLTPGTHEDCFYLAQKAFYLTDKYQIPVFLLTDQYLVDSSSVCNPFKVEDSEIQDFIIKTDSNYKRYKFTEDGVSPRGIAGYGDGLVKLCSDEHDEDGHSIENLDIRVQMTDKRLKKLDLIKKEVYHPELFGSENYKILLIGWGSTCNMIKETMKFLDMPDVAFLYFKQVYPLSEKTLDYLTKTQNTICIENNATGQFAKLIKTETGFCIKHKILKYNGLPFYTEELVNKIKGTI
ncbi:MAG: 2-oxoacid:acceptor oxidoreductase subunit alpha [Candidatus Gastranaerophilaceae bacterium]|jgi:2-oxoglutarate ferredoxin oxidoreductase subunit alpha